MRCWCKVQVPVEVSVKPKGRSQKAKTYHAARLPVKQSNESRDLVLITEES